MSWQQRLRALVLAGGAIVAAGCDGDLPRQLSYDMGSTDFASNVQGVCNANPDPCCLHPTEPGCPSDGGARD